MIKIPLKRASVMDKPVSIDFFFSETAPFFSKRDKKNSLYVFIKGFRIYAITHP